MFRLVFSLTNFDFVSDIWIDTSKRDSGLYCSETRIFKMLKTIFKVKTPYRTRAPRSLFLFSFKFTKFEHKYFKKSGKIPWHRQYCTLSFCKFSKRHTLYFGLNKNKKPHKKTKSSFLCTFPRIKFQFSFFAEPKIQHILF
jgi:hypothetical protein